jgi:hypothetical protein
VLFNGALIRYAGCSVPITRQLKNLLNTNVKETLCRTRTKGIKVVNPTSPRGDDAMTKASRETAAEAANAPAVRGSNRAPSREKIDRRDNSRWLLTA